MKSIPRSFVKIDNYKYMYISKRWTWINKIIIPTTTVLMFRKLNFIRLWQAQFYLLVASTSIKSMHNVTYKQPVRKHQPIFFFPISFNLKTIEPAQPTQHQRSGQGHLLLAV